MRAGKLEVGGSAVVTTATFIGGIASIYDNATAITTLTAENMARIWMERSVTTATIRNTQEAMFNSYSDAITTLTLENATLTYNGGTITTYTGKAGGVLDLRYIVQDIAITNATLHAGTTILYPTTGFTVTHSNAPTMVGGGPEWWQ